MPFSNDSARARRPRYQELWKRSSTQEVTAVQSWEHFGKILKTHDMGRNISFKIIKNVQSRNTRKKYRPTEEVLELDAKKSFS